MRKSALRLIVAAVAAAGLVTGAVPAESAANDYSNPDYLQHDLDNYSRARGRTIAEGSSPSYHANFAGSCADTQLKSAAKQANDARFGRVYGGVGQSTCWWSVGDADKYFDVSSHRVYFQSRTGAKLQGHVWGTSAPGPRPGIVITTGSIQASDQMYWWAARALASRGYVVLTYDVQGQGQSETFGHDPASIFPTANGVPSQQNANFYDGTVDALRFFMSTDEAPYVPLDWTPDQVSASKTASQGEQVDWVNPGASVLDRSRIGIIGHSLGASAVSAVQQCSDLDTVYQTAEVCHGLSFPIKAVVAWDALSGSGVTPVVPAMSQQSDGYFLFPTLSATAPVATESLGGYNLWKNAKKDIFSYVVRSGTHIEWSQVPYTASTTYGVHQNTYYTLAWMDRYLWGAERAQPAYEALRDGPSSASTLPWSSTYFSARRLSAAHITSPAADGSFESTDLRVAGGRSPVGDWVGANADTGGRVLP